MHCMLMHGNIQPLFTFPTSGISYTCTVELLCCGSPLEREKCPNYRGVHISEVQYRLYIIYNIKYYTVYIIVLYHIILKQSSSIGERLSESDNFVKVELVHSSTLHAHHFQGHA